MNKRVFSFFLSLVVLVAIAVPVLAENDEIAAPDLKISTAEGFLLFAENCRLDSFSRDLIVSLESDIDLTGTAFESVPIFCGTFLGNGHTISGLSITIDGSYQGLFRYLTVDATVQDLTVEGEIQPVGSGSAVGAIAGSNAGTIYNCSFIGTVSGSDYVAGIAGKNTVTGVIEACTVTGDIHGDHFVGGIAGENSGVIRGCTNLALVNTTPQQNSVELSDITLDTLTNSESAGTATDIGGIAGSSSGVIRECENHSNIGYKLMGYNIGGIAGTQSGYIADCSNYGSIQGRKEVGGITGQMEPTAQIEFTVDTLQILQSQLNSMAGTVSRTTANAQSDVDKINRHIGVLQSQAATARDAVGMLLPNAENPKLPDQDTILAAQNSLSSSLSSMPKTLKSIASATQSTVTQLTRDLNAISYQISAMSQTISGASNNLGGTVTDVSDQDKEEMLPGKVENCANFGSVYADMNAGGVAGAIAMENDLDVMEDWEQVGEITLNFQSEVRAVILNCNNSGLITAKKQNAGGIAGWQSLGLVKLSTNSGKIDAVDADYVGGISGQSTGFIRMNYAKCELSGDAYVGGIAGSAVIVTDSISHVRFLNAREKRGAILGWLTENKTEEENPVSGNYYLSAEEDAGGIDGISYAELAEPKCLEDFLSMESLPEMFQNVTVRFLFDDGTLTEIPVELGGDMPESMIPDIPRKDDCAGSWSGLDAAQLTDLYFDRSYETVYYAYHVVIESSETRDNGLPILLMEGSFTDGAELHAETSAVMPDLTEDDRWLESWMMRMNEPGTATRFLLPENVDTDQLKLFVYNSNGTWREADGKLSGSYLVFEISDGDEIFSLVQTQENHVPQMVMVGCAAALILLTGIALIVRKRKKLRAPEEVTQ